VLQRSVALAEGAVAMPEFDDVTPGRVAVATHSLTLDITRSISQALASDARTQLHFMQYVLDGMRTLADKLAGASLPNPAYHALRQLLFHAGDGMSELQLLAGGMEDKAMQLSNFAHVNTAALDELVGTSMEAGRESTVLYFKQQPRICSSHTVSSARLPPLPDMHCTEAFIALLNSLGPAVEGEALNLLHARSKAVFVIPIKRNKLPDELRFSWSRHRVWCGVSLDSGVLSAGLTFEEVEQRKDVFCAPDFTVPLGVRVSRQHISAGLFLMQAADWKVLGVDGQECELGPTVPAEEGRDPNLPVSAPFRTSVAWSMHAEWPLVVQALQDLLWEAASPDVVAEEVCHLPTGTVLHYPADVTTTAEVDWSTVTALPSGWRSFFVIHAVERTVQHRRVYGRLSWDKLMREFKRNPEALVAPSHLAPNAGHWFFLTEPHVNYRGGLWFVSQQLFYDAISRAVSAVSAPLPEVPSGHRLHAFTAEGMYDPGAAVADEQATSQQHKKARAGDLQGKPYPAPGMRYSFVPLPAEGEQYCFTDNSDETEVKPLPADVPRVYGQGTWMPWAPPGDRYVLRGREEQARHPDSKMASIGLSERCLQASLVPLPPSPADAIGRVAGRNRIPDESAARTEQAHLNPSPAASQGTGSPPDASAGGPSQAARRYRRVRRGGRQRRMENQARAGDSSRPHQNKKGSQRTTR
jgi:hypothetical protein